MHQSVDQHDLLAAELEEFMAVTVHDLRNPVAVVRASAQMAQRQLGRGETDGAQVRLKVIVEQTDRLTEMLEIFLDAARISSGRLVLRPERVDLRGLVELAADRARLLVSEHGERMLECLVPEGCIGGWDKARIARAVRALVSNALLYGDPSAPMHVEALRHGTRVHMTVSGGGPGPDAEEARHLFERFYRGPSAAEAGQSGSGLGLYTARGIARAHGGDVRWVDGDLFEIELPLSE
ncbi:MAG: HAMP domain-containing histidine kinase [Chloroflexota bacterium]|nr:HAMP domain-containing histidine kinase [Chloroflexota bacterium]